MKTILMFLLLIPSLMIGQTKNKTTLHDIDVSYEIIKKESNDKKDKYVLIINYINNTDSDLYYAEIGNDEYSKKHFGAVGIENTKGIFSGQGGLMFGDRTKLKLNTGETIYRISKGKMYTYNGGFSVEKDKTPIMTVKNGPVILTTELKDFLN